MREAVCARVSFGRTQAVSTSRGENLRMSEYDSDDPLRRSPPLQEVKVKLQPSPQRLPFIPRIKTPPPYELERQRRGRVGRHKTRASQGDAVLISHMEPNRPDIAREAGERPLNSGSESDMESEGRNTEGSDRAASPRRQPNDGNKKMDLMETAQAAVAFVDGARQPGPSASRGNGDGGAVNSAKHAVDLGTGPNGNPAPVHHEHTSAQGHRRTASNGIGLPTKSPELLHRSDSISKFSTASSRSDDNGRAHAINSTSPRHTLATSPNLREHTIKHPRGSPEQTLPAMQNGSSPVRNGDKRSPQPERSLPSFHHVAMIAQEAVADKENEARGSGAFPPAHRHSVPSPNMQAMSSPPLPAGRHYSLGPHASPPAQFPSIGQAVSMNGEVASPDRFLKASGLQIFSFSRRQSQASENVPPLSASIPSASTEGFNSSDSFSPAAQPVRDDGRHRMSVDGAVRPTLPLPQPSIPPHSNQGLGTFRCDHPGCTAPPFQTQYLLK